MGDPDGKQRVRDGFLADQFIAAGLGEAECLLKFADSCLRLALPDKQPAPVHKKIGCAERAASRKSLIKLFARQLPKLIAVSQRVGSEWDRALPLAL